MTYNEEIYNENQTRSRHVEKDQNKGIENTGTALKRFFTGLFFTILGGGFLILTVIRKG